MLREDGSASNSVLTDAGLPTSERDGHTEGETQQSSASRSHLINELIDLQRQRRFCITSQSRCDRSCEAFIARSLGYASPKEKDADRSGEKARKALFARARAIRVGIEKGGHEEGDDHTTTAPEAGGEGQTEGDHQHDGALSACTPIVINSAAARSAWDALRKQAEKRMRQIARLLPAFAWASTIEGFDALGVAIIVGETGDLRNYATKERVWKRLGLAPFHGKACSTWAIEGGLSAKEWIEAGYSRARRGTIAGDITAPLFFAKSKNRYGEVYAARRAHTAITHPEWTKGHSDNDARRIMTKTLIEDLWIAWNK